MKAENLITLRMIKKQIVRIGNEARIKSIYKRVTRLNKLYLYMIIKYK